MKMEIFSEDYPKLIFFFLLILIEVFKCFYFIYLWVN